MVPSLKGLYACRTLRKEADTGGREIGDYSYVVGDLLMSSSFRFLGIITQS